MKRQGNLLFLRSENTHPLQTSEECGPVLDRGEATGATHSIAPEDLDRCAVRQLAGGRLQIEVREPVRVEHPEHGTVTLEPGVWEVRRQREYRPGASGVVRD